MDSSRSVQDDGAVAIKGDNIVAVGPATRLKSKYVGAHTIDAQRQVGHAGFINGHTHVPMTLFRGLHDDVTLDDWLRKYIFPAEAKNVTEEFVRWGTRLAAAEQIRFGVTTFADMYYFEDAVAEETKAAGMRGVLGETWIDFPAPDNKNEAAMLAYTEAFLKKWQGDPLIHAVRRAALHLHLLPKDAGGRCSAGPEISRAHPDPRRRNEKGVGRLRKTKRHVAGAISGTRSEFWGRMCSRRIASLWTQPTARPWPISTWAACTILRAT